MPLETFREMISLCFSQMEKGDFRGQKGVEQPPLVRRLRPGFRSLSLQFQPTQRYNLKQFSFPAMPPRHAASGKVETACLYAEIMTFGAHAPRSRKDIAMGRTGGPGGQQPRAPKRSALGFWWAMLRASLHYCSAEDKELGPSLTRKPVS